MTTTSFGLDLSNKVDYQTEFGDTDGIEWHAFICPCCNNHARHYTVLWANQYGREQRWFCACGCWWNLKRINDGDNHVLYSIRIVKLTGER
jgi:hypothetical protein